MHRATLQRYHISTISPLYLPYISHISPISPLYLLHRATLLR